MSKRSEHKAALKEIRKLAESRFAKPKKTILCRVDIEPGSPIQVRVASQKEAERLRRKGIKLAPVTCDQLLGLKIPGE